MLQHKISRKIKLGTAAFYDVWPEYTKITHNYATPFL